MSFVFISYSHVDSVTAGDITKHIEENGIGYFQDVKHIEWGTSIKAEVRKALEASIAILVIVSPASLKSHWVPYEIGYASALRKRVLPFLTHSSLDVPDYIRELNYCTTMGEVIKYFKTSFPPEEKDVFSIKSSNSNSIFEKLYLLMPKLLNEMREDIENDETKLIRECVLLSSRTIMFNGDGRQLFAYYKDEHDDLQNKMILLEQHNLLTDVTPNNTPIYRMTEELVDLLTIHQS